MIITGLGLDARNTDSVDLVSKVHRISAEILGGKDLTIHEGNDRFDYDRIVCGRGRQRRNKQRQGAGGEKRSDYRRKLYIQQK
ncbi:MAG: hypothetical protein LBT81_05645 [Helicobacteraceae bacterium]|jgi:hypothetical protein|nr:hypothetical protein [Helicobacteraceae bacterium]